MFFPCSLTGKLVNHQAYYRAKMVPLGSNRRRRRRRRQREQVCLCSNHKHKANQVHSSRTTSRTVGHSRIERTYTDEDEYEYRSLFKQPTNAHHHNDNNYKEHHNQPTKQPSIQPATTTRYGTQLLQET